MTSEKLIVTPVLRGPLLILECVRDTSNGRPDELAESRKNNISVVKGPQGIVASAIFVNQTTLAIAVKEEGSTHWTVRLWNVESQKELARVKPNSMVPSLAFDRHTGTLIIPEFEGPITLWDTQTHKARAVLESKEHVRHDHVALTPDGKTLITTRSLLDTSIGIWDLPRSKRSAILNAYSGELDGIDALMPFPDGERFVTGRREDSVKVWDLS